MAWVWGARFECGHETGGTIDGAGTYCTPVELEDVLYCPQCRTKQPVILTWGRGR